MIPGAVRGRLPGESRMPSPAGVALTNTTPGGAHPIGTAAGALRPPRVERLVFRCEPSTPGVVWLIAAPAFSLTAKTSSFRCLLGQAAVATKSTGRLTTDNGAFSHITLTFLLTPKPQSRRVCTLAREILQCF